jgi:hypothetical protein
MGPQPCLDVRDWHSGGKAGKRGAERARSIALDDEKVGPSLEPRAKRRGDRADVPVRVFVAPATEPLCRKSTQPEISRFEIRVLPSEDQRRFRAALRKRVRDRCQFDRFGPGADDQADVREIQPSP